MAWQIPNYLDTIEYPVASSVYPQAQWDKVDGDILNDNAGVGGVSSGCAVTQTAAGANQAVDVASGTVVVNNVEVAVSSGNVAAAAAHATLPRFDLVVVNGSGTKSITAGTAASVPVFPAIPASSVVLASLFRRPADNTIATAEIVDKRRVVRSPLAAAGWTTVSKGADQTKNSDTTFANDSALTFALAASTKYRVRAVIWINAGATPDFKWQLTGPASPTVVAIHFENYNGTTGAFSSGGYDTAFSTSHANVLSNAADVSFNFYGIIHNGTNAETLAFQWAQNTSDAANTTVRAGSYIEYAVA